MFDCPAAVCPVCNNSVWTYRDYTDHDMKIQYANPGMFIRATGLLRYCKHTSDNTTSIPCEMSFSKV